MPDILIRGIEMPKNCMVCDFRNRGFDLNGDLYCNCRVTKEDVPDFYNIRMESCPLVELPEHGDLIDICNAENALFVAGNYHLNDYKQGWNDGIEAVIENAPVIVPANKEETE